MKTLLAAFALVLVSAASAAGAISPYSSKSFVPGVRTKPTGFFRVEFLDDGRWWAVDPIGRGFVPMGVDLVRSCGFRDMLTGRRAYRENVVRRFPDMRDWQRQTIGRLESWGFNLLGARSDASLYRRGLAHTVSLLMGVSLCEDGCGEELWICPKEKHPSRAFPNVFDPQFEEHCEKTARRLCAPMNDDPWLFGYFIDNELAWWGRAAKGSATGLFDAVMDKDESHSAKKELRAFLARRGIEGEVPENVKLDFLRLAAERYFSTTCAAIRRNDPNHLVLGPRFAGIDGAHDAVWEIAGKYCDVVSFNFYAWADLDRNTVRVSKSLSSPSVSEAVAGRHALCRRPLFVTEWSFPALDSGLPCTFGAGQRFRTQSERTTASRLFAETLLASPHVIGYDWFMWCDEPENGLGEYFRENSNYGLVNEQDEPYRELTAMFAEMQPRAGTLRKSPFPVPRSPFPVPRSPFPVPLCEAFPEFGKPVSPGGVAFKREGSDFEVSTRGGLVLSGTTDVGPLLRNISLVGRTIGSFNAMVDFRNADMRWKPIARTTGASFAETSGWGYLVLTGEGGDAENLNRFSLSLEFTIHPDKPVFACRLTGIKNKGRDPLDLAAFYFSQFPAFVPAKDKGVARVPNLWKAPSRDFWMDAATGLRWGGTTKSPFCTSFHYFVSEKDGSAHPDAKFEPPDGSLRLAPGKSFGPGDAVWAVFKAEPPSPM